MDRSEKAGAGNAGRGVRTIVVPANAGKGPIAPAANCLGRHLFFCPSGITRYGPGSRLLAGDNWQVMTGVDKSPAEAVNQANNH